MELSVGNYLGIEPPELIYREPSVKDFLRSKTRPVPRSNETVECRQHGPASYLLFVLAMLLIMLAFVFSQGILGSASVQPRKWIKFVVAGGLLFFLARPFISALCVQYMGVVHLFHRPSGTVTRQAFGQSAVTVPFSRCRALAEKKRLALLFPAPYSYRCFAAIQADQTAILLYWQFLQRFMDKAHPLPDIPEFEEFRDKDPVSAAYDRAQGREEGYWRKKTEFERKQAARREEEKAVARLGSGPIR